MPLKNPRSLRAARSPAAFTLMEILVVVAIILVLAAIAFPVYSTVLRRSHKITAINNMRQITTALVTYTTQNDGDFPDENIPAGSTWTNAANPEMGARVWYNSLPRLLGRKGVGDYPNTEAGHTSYYTKENLLFLPGALYPPPAKRLLKPHFALALNTKLQRISKTTKLKSKAKMSQITHPSRTVAFFEVGMLGEPKAMAIQAAYDDGGDPKSYGKSFVTRYGGRGVVTFLDGHAEDLEAKRILNDTGRVKVPPETDILWAPDSDIDPNVRLP